MSEQFSLQKIDYDPFKGRDGDAEPGRFYLEPADGGDPFTEADNAPSALSRGFVSGLLDQNPRMLAETLEGMSYLSHESFSNSLRNASEDVRAVADLSPEEYRMRAGSIFDARNLEEALSSAGETLGQGLASTVPSVVTGVMGTAAGSRLGGRKMAAAGGMAGAAVPSAALNYGEVYRALKDEGVAPEQASEYALYATGPMVVLDMVSVGPIVSRLGGMQEAKRQVARRIARRVAEESAKGAGREGITEAAQEAVKEATVSLAADKPFWTVETAKAVGEAGFGGAMTGGVLGGAAGVRRDRVPAPDADRMGNRAEAARQGVDVTPGDEASPIPTDIIAEGKATVQDAGASMRANDILDRNQIPRVGERVTVRLSDGTETAGVVEDAYEMENAELGVSDDGIRVRLDNGRAFEEFVSSRGPGGWQIGPEQMREAEPPAPSLPPAEAMPGAPSIRMGDDISDAETAGSQARRLAGALRRLDERHGDGTRQAPIQAQQPGDADAAAVQVDPQPSDAQKEDGISRADALSMIRERTGVDDDLAAYVLDTGHVKGTGQGFALGDGRYSRSRIEAAVPREGDAPRQPVSQRVTGPAAPSAGQAPTVTTPREEPQEAPQAGETAARPQAPGGSETATQGAALTIEDLSEKSIIIKGRTRENKDRIKAAVPGVGALWNKKRQGWVFPKKREAEVRQALTDIPTGQGVATSPRTQEGQPTAAPVEAPAMAEAGRGAQAPDAAPEAMPGAQPDLLGGPSRTPDEMAQRQRVGEIVDRLRRDSPELSDDQLAKRVREAPEEDQRYSGLGREVYDAVAADRTTRRAVAARLESDAKAERKRRVRYETQRREAQAAETPARSEEPDETGSALRDDNAALVAYVRERRDAAADIARQPSGKPLNRLQREAHLAGYDRRVAEIEGTDGDLGEVPAQFTRGGDRTWYLRGQTAAEFNVGRFRKEGATQSPRPAETERGVEMFKLRQQDERRTEGDVDDGGDDDERLALRSPNRSAERRRFGMPKETARPIRTFETDAGIKAHPDYAAAKAGDVEAAIRLVPDLVTEENVAEAAERFGPDVVYVAPHAEEAAGRNAIPQTLARYYAARTGAAVDAEVVQASRAFHTGAKPMERIVSRPTFDGAVEAGRRYVLVDDVSVMGGTLAELANHIREGGGEVVGAVTLVNASRSGILAPKSAHLTMIERRYGDVIRESLRIEPAALTADEAVYILGSRDADALRDRIAAAEQARDRRLREKGVRPPGAEDGRLRASPAETTETPAAEPAFSLDRVALEATLRERLKRYRLDDKVALRVADRIRAYLGGELREADGRYTRRLIEVAMDGADPVAALDHEAIHALRDLGLIKQTEWAMLRDRARRDDALMDRIEQEYAAQGLDEEALLEEAVAVQFAERGRKTGIVERLIERLRGVLEDIRAWFTGEGYETAEAVFRAVERGRVGAREESPLPRSATEAFAASARDDTAPPRTDTPEFKRWFGDSKVVDENGEPLVVYHGTNAEFDVFDVGRVGENFPDDAGFFFSSDEDTAWGFGRTRKPDGSVTVGADNVMPVYLSLENPLVLDAGRDDPTEFWFLNADAYKNQMIEGGHDGAIVRGEDFIDDEQGSVVNAMYVARRPEQIKSATGNRGTFDPDDPDIRFALRSAVGGRGRARTRPEPRPAAGGVRFTDPGSEKRWQDAKKGSRSPKAVRERITAALTGIAHGFSRHYVDLPNNRRFADVREQLRKLEAAPNASKERIIRILRSITDGMTQSDMDLFTRKVVLDDLAYEAERDHALPFGLTKETLPHEIKKVDRAMAERPELQQKIRERKLIVQTVARDLVDAGVLDREQVKNPAYYRHQVLDYARAQVRYAQGAGRRVRTPKWARRMGSELDINANLLEAEFEWLQKAMVDVATAKTIDWIKRSEHNVRKDVIEAARAHNDRLVKKAITGDQRLQKQWRAFRSRIAFGVKIVRDAIESGELQVPREYRRGADSLEAAAADGDASIFPLLSWMLDNDQPGAEGAGLVFEAIGQRKQWVRDLLGERYADPNDIDGLVRRGFAPAGHVAWQPDEGRLLFTAKTIPEHVVDRLVRHIARDPEGTGIQAEQMMAALNSVRDLVALGGPKHQLVVPEEIAATLNSFRDEFFDGPIDDLFSIAQSYWKRWVLINPRRVLKYNLNNLSGDMDAVIAGNPKALRHMGRAIKELYAVMRKGEAPSARYREAVERGVFDSGLSVQEIPDINMLSQFEHLIDPPTVRQPARFALSGLMKVWRLLQGYTQFRENWLRYAAYIDYAERLEAGEAMESIGYGAAKKEMIDGIREKKDKAAMLARELVGDYGAVSEKGRWMRRHLIPFYSWLEINTKRYWRLGINAWDQGVGQGLRTTGTVGALLGARTTAYLGFRMALLYGLVALWNNLVFGDEEDELDAQERARLHLIVGRGDDGEVYTLKFQGALSDFLGWVGFENVIGAIGEIEKGRAGASDVLEAVAKAPVNRVLNGVTPVVSMPVQLLSGYTYWPDVFRPRAIKDRTREVFRLFSMEHEYDLVMNRPTRGYGQSLVSTVTYGRDPGEIAYNNTRGLAFDWIRRERGTEGSGNYITDRSRALYDYRLAKRFGDRDAARDARRRMADLGMTEKDIARSVKRAHPMGPVPIKDREAFKRTLDARERRQLRDAIAWWDRTFND